MKLSQARLAAILALFGIYQNQTSAMRDQTMPSEIEMKTQDLENSGLISIDPVTGNPDINFNLLEQLRAVGRVNVISSGDSTICPTGGD